MSDGACRNGRVVDAATAAIFVVVDLVVTLVGATWWPNHPGALAWTMLVLQAVAGCALVGYRRFPLTVLGIIGAYTLALTLLISPAGALTPAHDGRMWAPYATVVAAYGPTLCGRIRRRDVVAEVALTIVVARPWDPSVTIIAIGLARTAIGPLLTLFFAARRRVIQELTERAERAERERHLLAGQARAEERARLAGEMHDVVTHRVSLMVLQAGALQMTATDPETRRAADELRAAGCQALDELRDLVGILRAMPEGDETPSLSGLAQLVEESGAVGTPVTLEEDGDPTLASPLVGRTAYRVVREALTNARKHAPGAPVVVRVHYDNSEVRLTVRNDRPMRRPDPILAASGSGLGIAGLRQRLELVHGSLTAGPTPDGGFCVEATLPAFVPTAEPAV